jgi:hypothetical protein
MIIVLFRVFEDQLLGFGAYFITVPEGPGYGRSGKSQRFGDIFYGKGFELHFSELLTFFRRTLKLTNSALIAYLASPIVSTGKRTGIFRFPYFFLIMERRNNACFFAQHSPLPAPGNDNDTGNDCVKK